MHWPHNYSSAWRDHRLTLTLLLLACLAVVSVVRAEPTRIPTQLQARLLDKVVKYDRNLRARAKGRVKVLVVMRRGDAESERTGQLLLHSLGELSNIGGLPHEVQAGWYSSAAALRKLVQDDHLSMIYLAPGLGSEVSNIARAVAGLDVLTVSADPSDVPNGIVLGFDLVSGKPVPLVLLPAAKRQHVAFSPQALKLMKVYR